MHCTASKVATHFFVEIDVGNARMCRSVGGVAHKAWAGTALADRAAAGKARSAGKAWSEMKIGYNTTMADRCLADKVIMIDDLAYQELVEQCSTHVIGIQSQWNDEQALVKH